MEQSKKLDESLLDQSLNDFIHEFLVPQYKLKYTDFSYDYDKFYFYLKFKDKLIPSLFVRNGSYCFNTALCLRLPMGILVDKYNKRKEVFFDYLLIQLDLSEEYFSYLNRLEGVPMTLYEKLKQDHISARKGGDVIRISLLGTLINDINESILKGLSMSQYGILKPTDEQVLAVIKQYVKNANTTLEIAGSDPRTEAELEILQSYQPSLLTDEEIVTIYKEFKDSFGGNEKALYGAFMKHLTQNYAYRYEGGKVRSIVSGV